MRLGPLAAITLIACLGASSLACADAPASESSNMVRDSAGVRIVESLSTARHPAPWTLGAEPVWSVGRLEGDPDYLLSRVVGAHQLPDGSILIANGGTSQVRFYDPSGVLVASRGREGQGPGEFAYLRALGTCRDDGFVAFDLNWEMNAYRADGTFVEKTVLRAPEGITPYNLACDPHGHVLLLGWGRNAAAGPVVGFHETRDRLVLVTREGAVETDFGERLVSERIGTTGGSGPHPAGRATQFALHDDRAFIGSGERFEVEVRALDGSLLALLRGPDIDLSVTDSIRSLYLENRLASAPAERHPVIRRQAEEMAWPEQIPAFVELRVDEEGVLWLRAYASPGSPETWSLLHPEAGYLGDLRLSARHRLLEAGSDYLLLLTRDDLDVERVVKLTLDRHGASYTPESPRRDGQLLQPPAAGGVEHSKRPLAGR
jgi:hypothetical protein